MTRASISDTGWLTKRTILLLMIALVTRTAVSAIQVAYGAQRMPYLPLNNWADYYLMYAHWLLFVHQGILPYRDFYSYKYPPLFLYTLYPFYWAGGIHAAAIPIVASDAVTALFVYLIARTSAGENVAFAAGLTYALSPFVLYEMDYLWLVSQPMALFVLMAVYFLKSERPLLSAASLATAVMFRQEALFILPPYLVYFVARYRSQVLRGVGLFAVICLGISLPFLIIAPVDYLYSINYFPGGHFINLGPLEPSAPGAAAIVNAANAAQPTGGAGPAYAAYLGILDRMATLLDPLLLLLLVPAIYAARKSAHILELTGAFSFLAGLTAYSDAVGPAFAYYFVPVYALIFASISNARTAALGVATAILCLVVPEGPFQVIPPALCLIAITALQ